MTTEPLDWIVIPGSRPAPATYGLEGRNPPTRVLRDSLQIRYAGSSGAESNLDWYFSRGGSSICGRPVVKQDEADIKRFSGKDEKQHHSARRRKDGGDFLVFFSFHSCF